MPRRAISKKTQTDTAAQLVYDWLIEGRAAHWIAASIKDRYPKLDSGQLIAECLDRFAATADCDRDTLNGWALEAYRELYRRMVAEGDYGGALKAVKELTALAERVYTDQDQDTTTPTPEV